jgi:hypothetical protein
MGADSIITPGNRLEMATLLICRFPNKTKQGRSFPTERSGRFGLGRDLWPADADAASNANTLIIRRSANDSVSYYYTVFYTI